MWYFSKSTNGFYTKEINGSIPADAISIPDEDYLLLRGRSLSTDFSGNPIIQDDRETDEVLIQQERIWRNNELLNADVQLNKVQDGDSKAVGTVGLWRAYRKELRNWPESADFPNKAKRPVSPAL